MKGTLFIALMGLILAFASGAALAQENASNPLAAIVKRTCDYSSSIWVVHRIAMTCGWMEPTC